MGEMTLHGPHHVAQKSKTAGLSPLIYRSHRRTLEHFPSAYTSKEYETYNGLELVEGRNNLDNHDDSR